MELKTIPILKKDVPEKSILNINTDFEYIHSDQDCLSIDQIKSYFDKRYIINSIKKKGECLKHSDFKKAKIGIIVVCRLQSNRLPNKALLKIGKLTAVETCIKNVLQFEHVDLTCLATSTEEDNAILENYKYAPEVVFHKGSRDDVLERMMDVIDKFDIDIVSRVTADTVFPSNEIYQILLKSHFETGADYTKSNNAAFGLNLSVISVSALRKVKKYFPITDYSEYLIYYLSNNPTHFTVNSIDLPKNFERDYRLTLDYPEDFELIKATQNYLESNQLESTAHNIYSFLDNNPKIASINKSMKIKYETDPELIKKIKNNTIIKDV